MRKCEGVLSHVFYVYGWFFLELCSDLVELCKLMKSVPSVRYLGNCIAFPRIVYIPCGTLGPTKVAPSVAM